MKVQASLDISVYDVLDHDSCSVTMEMMHVLHKLGLSEDTARMELPDLTKGPAVWRLILYRE